MDKKETIYICPKCKELVKRNSDKGWIKSYCTKTDVFTRLQKLKLPF